MVNATSATATITTADDMNYIGDYSPGTGGWQRHIRYITINIDDYATGYITMSVEANSGFEMLCENAMIEEPANRTIRVTFTHEKYILVILYSDIYAPDVTAWSINATLDEDGLTEVIANQEIIIQDLNNIDNTLDTITWSNFNATYTGFTNDNGDTYNTQSGYHNAGWYVINNVRFSGSYSGAIYKLTIPLGADSTTINNIKFGQLYNSEWYEFIPDTILYLPQRSVVIVYFTINETYHQWPQSNYPLGIYYNKRMYYYNDYSFKAEYILQNDIEYWTLYNAMKINKQIELLQTISQGINDTSTTQSIDQVTQQLNDATQQSQAAETQSKTLLRDFNNNINLNNFDYSNEFNGGFVQYYKDRLTDIYDINEFKPFYLVPIILSVLVMILGG